MAAIGLAATLWAAGHPIIRRLDAAGAPVNGAVWALAESRDGTQWVGSNVLAAGDGQRWETIDLPGAYAFRGLSAAADGRVWAGARGALGYLTRDAAGAWHYTSLLGPLQQAGMSDPGDIWQVCALGRGAAFVTTDRVLRWDGDKFETWLLPAQPHLQAFPDDDALFVYQGGVGLHRLRATGAPSLEIAESDLPEKPVTWLVALPDGSALLGLGNNAYRRARVAGGNAGGTPSGMRFTRLDALSEALRDALPSCATRVGPRSVAIGTFKRGIVFANAAGGVVNRADSRTGLGDDSVYTLAAGSASSVWAGLGNGYARIEAPDVVTVLDAAAGLNQGTPLKVLPGGAQVLTGKMLYAVGADRLEPLIDAQPLLWDAAVIDQRLWIGGFGGLWVVDGARTVHEHHVSADVLHLTASSRIPGAVVFLENYELMALERGAYGWVPRHLDARVADTPLSLLEDEQGDIWVSTVVGGIYRFAGPEEPGGGRAWRLAMHYRAGAGLPRTAAQPRLTLLGGRLYAFTADEILVLNEARTAFAPAPGLAGFSGLAAAAFDGGAYWVVRSRALGPNAPVTVVRIDGTASAWQAVATPGLDAAGPVTSCDFITAPDGPALWIGGRRGLVRIAEAGLQPAPGVGRLTLRQAQADDTALGLDGSVPAAMPVGVRHLVFRFPLPDRGDGPFFYQTRLEGVEAEWLDPTPEPRREFTGLAPGLYAFAARAVDRFGLAGPATVYRFAIAAPWYRRPVALTSFALGTVLGLAGLVRWRLRQLRRQNERLNQLVADRTRELELAGAAKSEFLENISHELRNPLNGLTGLLELLHEEELKPRELELARSLKLCAENLTRGFEEVLGFAKLEYGCITVEKKPFLLGQLLHDLADMFAVQAAHRTNTLTVKLPANFVDGFAGDANKIKTILGNFVTNALKYAPGGPVELTAESQPAAGGMVELFVEVTDHGPGVPPDEQELIFQKFVRGSLAKNDGVTGAGLGLATCRVLARALNGSVGLESEPGHGATFYLRLLVARAAPPSRVSGLATAARNDEPDGPARLLEPPKAPPAAGGAGEAALIVDDEPYNRTVLQGIALALGYRPETAANAEEAFTLIERVDFSVIFLDWELPGRKGGEVSRGVRARPGGAAPLIIATTAHDSDEARDRCLAAGMDGVLLKPYNLAQVRRLIAELRARCTAGPGSAAVTEDRPGQLDLEAFALYARAAPAQAAEAVPRFIAAVDRELDLLAQAAKTGDAAGAAQAVHRARALGSLIGARVLVEQAGRLETLARAGRSGELGPVLTELAAEWQSLRGQLAAAPPFMGAGG